MVNTAPDTTILKSKQFKCLTSAHDAVIRRGKGKGIARQNLMSGVLSIPYMANKWNMDHPNKSVRTVVTR